MHPYLHFLFGDVIAHQGTRAFIACATGSFGNFALQGNHRVAGQSWCGTHPEYFAWLLCR